MTDLENKAHRAMRRYRQTAAWNDAAARAIRRLMQTKTWRGIVADRDARQSHYTGERLSNMGY